VERGSHRLACRGVSNGFAENSCGEFGLWPEYSVIMDTGRQAQLACALESILQNLISQYQPEKIILFGSMAEGGVKVWSDLDLVIIKETTKPFLQRLKEVALLCRSSVGVDFLVYRPSEFEQMIAEGNPFILQEVINKGRVLYERQPVSTVA
jgi:uncharacterized protein